MAKASRAQGDIILFHCPGCKCGHGIPVDPHPKAWAWNGSLESPTFSPSIHVIPCEGVIGCHSFVTDGNIQFLPDCQHELAGQTIPLPEFD
ncbi:DUF6527 family protein [Terriglobus albidus]|uniref:DUF6527 family protein n=1 Tax=Terriglobus albidus TaxID=1592106 RepID=UPI0021DF770A|nr:DUF6527 family protein [Terriglobus albidus]